MKILLADDHQLVREGLKVTLGLLDDHPEIIEAASLTEVLQALDAHSDLNLVILDLRMPGMGNWSGLDQVRASRPEVPVAIISASRERHDILEALARGAGGYIPKSLSMTETIAALREILRGGIFDPTPGQAEQGVPSLPPDDRFDELSPRERHVLALLSDGCSNKEIARRLSLQEVTVKAHLKQVFRKLSVTNRTQAVKLVLRAGWNG